METITLSYEFQTSIKRQSAPKASPFYAICLPITMLSRSNYLALNNRIVSSINFTPTAVCPSIWNAPLIDDDDNQALEKFYAWQKADNLGRLSTANPTHNKPITNRTPIADSRQATTVWLSSFQLSTHMCRWVDACIVMDVRFQSQVLMGDQHSSIYIHWSAKPTATQCGRCRYHTYLVVR